MLTMFRMDLHIHSCLSPCGDPASVPTRIISGALQKGLQAVALTDHNASENVEPLKRAAEKTGLTVFGGMEITSQEEIHVLAIFDGDDDLASMQELVYDHLPGRYDGKHFGEQYIVDEQDYAVGYNEHLLMGATDLSINQLIEAVHAREGLAVASHIDRGAFSIISQLGFIPEGMDLDALELSGNFRKSGFSPDNLSYPVITASDAHHPDDIGRFATDFFIHTPDIEEIRLALQGVDGRKLKNLYGI